MVLHSWTVCCRTACFYCRRLQRTCIVHWCNKGRGVSRRRRRVVGCGATYKLRPPSPSLMQNTKFSCCHWCYLLRCVRPVNGVLPPLVPPYIPVDVFVLACLPACLWCIFLSISLGVCCRGGTPVALSVCQAKRMSFARSSTLPTVTRRKMLSRR